MKEHSREKNDTRARALAAHDRNYWVRLLATVDTWFPVYRIRHPDADRAKVVAQLAALADGVRRRGFSDNERTAPPAVSDSAVLFDASPTRRRLKGLPDLHVGGTTSGVVKASAFKVFNIESPNKSDTQDQSAFSSAFGDPSSSDFSNTHEAFFWAGFSRLDSTWDQIDIFHGSPSDRAVHMAVLQVDLPRPTSRVVAQIRTSMFITLAQGVEIINDWGFFDDQDNASLKIDFCGAFTRDGAGFPDPQAFGFTPAFNLSSSSHHFLSQDADMSRSVVLLPSDKPSLFLGMRWTFAAADTRMQTGFTEQARNSFFGFQHLDTGAPGVLYSYDSEPVLSQ